MITDGSETQPPQPLSKLLSKKEKLLTITALSGEFPCDNFHRLHISSSYAKLLRHNLYQEGMIKSLSDDCLKGLVLTSKGIEVLKQKESSCRTESRLFLPADARSRILSVPRW